MGYYLLTGATGLLGSYLLRDFLRSGLDVAVVVRPSRLATPQQRIEAILQYWEREDGQTLPRPMVLVGDLASPLLDLDASTLRWVGENCQAVVHSAASLSFQGDDLEDGEPWRTNIGGTTQVLQLARQLGLRRFHHVSTAYVCGFRQGLIRESELDLGQPLGNDYERSKLQAEVMVRHASFLESVTIYRPSIIVGDSRTGYTASFHGFYTPLRIAEALARSGLLQMEMVHDRLFLDGLNMTGQERKNFVPVDWVSAALTAILVDPACHGRTYHLTNPRPTSIQLMHETMLEALLARFLAQAENGVLPRQQESFPASLDVLEGHFRKQLEVYQTYWRDDPKFAADNTLEMLGHLPCPTLDKTSLRRLIDFALEANFGYRSQSAVGSRLSAIGSRPSAAISSSPENWPAT